MTEYLTVYTDGACKGNPGPGGWGFAIERGADAHHRTYDGFSGEIQHTTNNAAELWAVYNALLELPAHSCILFVTDSRLVIGWLVGFNGKKWRRNKEHIITPCELIDDLKEAKNIRWAFRQVKGHAENEGNNMADRLASNAANRVKYRR
jgi:ribonuclease HI